MEKIIIQLINWPFLAFVFLVLIIIVFKNQFIGILNRGDIIISWGNGNSIRLKDLSDSFDKELDPIRDEIKELKSAIDRLSSKKSSEYISDNLCIQSESIHNDILSRMKYALTNSEYTWRSLERLAIIGGVSENEAINILRSDPNVTFGIGKTGNRIAKLKNR